MSLFSFMSNPIAFAAATVLAIGVIVYGIVSQQNEERAHTSGRGSSDKRRNHDSDSSSSTFYRSSESSADFRRRKREESKTKPCSENKVMKQSIKKSPDEVIEAKKNAFDAGKYKENVFNKMEKDIKNINQGDEKKKQFDKNIDVSDSPESEDPAILNETKVINTIAPTASENNAPQHVLGSGPKKMEGKKGNDPNNQETKQTNFNDLASVGGAAAMNDQHDGTNLMCRACEDVPAKAVAYPCNHCYLCEDCARIVYRIYKKCTICNSVILSYETAKR